MAASGGSFIGIDLGTTNSVVAWIDPHGRPTSLVNSEGDLLTPSVVYFEADAPAIVGKEGLKAGRTDPDNVIVAVKRDMGKEFCSKPIRGRKLPPAAISGVILHRLISDAAEHTGEVRRAVVTVPAYFNEPRRKATVDAARMAGLEEVELINEPTAAALAFGYQVGVFREDGSFGNIQTKIAGQYNVLVYDLGGGTFDVTLMRIAERHFTAVVTDGDVQLGGLDWDERIVDYALRCFEGEFGIDLRSDEEAMLEVRREAEELKRSLSQRKQAIMRLQFHGQRLNIEMTRDDLLELTADLLGRTRMTCELAMRDAEMTWDKLDAVILVGGSTRMPMVRDMLLELTGIEPSRNVSPDEAVAQGAALYAQMLWGRNASGKIDEEVEASLGITNVNSHSLGLVGRDRSGDRRVAVLIPKNTALPHSNSKTFRTRQRGQQKIFCQIVEGEAEDPAYCTVVGEARLRNLPPDLPEDHPVKITFAYRRDGRLFVEAEVAGHPPRQIEIAREQGVEASDIKAWADELGLQTAAGAEGGRPEPEAPRTTRPMASRAAKPKAAPPAAKPAAPPEEPPKRGQTLRMVPPPKPRPEGGK